MFRVISLFSFISLTVVVCYGDVNLHNPRGSNNRQDEATRPRTNGNRIFDSQNNNRGGHNVGPKPAAMTFYSGSTLYVRWAHQHSSGDENSNANVVLQYMCDVNLKDGTTTTTIPINKGQCTGANCDTDPRFGHHESLTYYENCASRSRNKGLFISNRNLNGDSAQYTRQNNNGQRRGYECPEERDHWPYFGPSPWRDIAVFTNDLSKCQQYKAESQNVKSKWACALPDDYWKAVRGTLLKGNAATTTVRLGATKDSCGKTTVTAGGKTYTPKWTEFPKHEGAAAPDCLKIQYARDNHQGNTIGGEFATYKWKVPKSYSNGNCAFRLRYNISTNDFNYWDTDSKSNGDTGPSSIWQKQGLTKAQGKARGYTLTNNPNVNVFNTNKFNLQLAVNTAQYGRTFQDRSHSFKIKQRPANIPGNAEIININVRGKRGNIVQVFPSVEYDFEPNYLVASPGTYVQFQWTGSNNNPANNAGEGTAGTDRSNVVQLKKRQASNFFGGEAITLRNNYVRRFTKSDLLGMKSNKLTELAFSGPFTNANKPGNLLNQASVFFNTAPVKISRVGTYYYACTRNNNFSNRNQKGTIIITTG